MIGHVRRHVGSSLKTRSLVGRVFILLVALLLADLVGSVVVSALQLRHAGHALEDAATALRHDDLATAARSVIRAEVAAGAASDLTGHPGFRLLSVVPGVKDETGALEALVDVAGVGSAAAARFVASLDSIGAGTSGIVDALYRDGAIDLEALDVLERASENLAADLADARGLLEGHSDVSIGVLARAVARAGHRLDSFAASSERGLNVARLVPPMVGRDEPRRYLLAFQSPSEARGGGGLIGVYGLLSARGGRVTLDEVGPIEDLGPRVRPPIAPPAGFSDAYAGFSALSDWRQANLSPNFPATSEVLLSLYERVRGERLDGVIAMDPIALGELTRGTGALKAPGWHKAITRNNARRLLLFRIYKHFVNREKVQNTYLRSLVDELWGRVEAGDLDPAGLVTGIDSAVAKQHLKIYSSDPGEEALLVELGVASDPRAVTGALQAVFNNNNAGNKLDFFLRRAQEIAIDLDADGTARINSSVSLTNDVPRNGLRAAARSGVRNGLDLGTNRMSLHFMLPRGARFGSYSIGGRRMPAYRGRDGGFPVVWQVVEVRPEETVEARVVYLLPNAVSLGPTGGRFSFTLWPQTTVRPDSYEVTVSAPPGYAFGAPEGGTKQVVTVTGRLKEPYAVVLWVIPAAEGS